jgi:sugar transferase EpsL
VKRICDIAIAVMVIVITSPILVLTSLAILISMGPPICFCQMRLGIRGKPFVIYKFRTMVDGRNEDGTLLPDEKRLTKLGKMLRSSSIDELPELLNVIKGDMSIIGPRPLLVDYYKLYTKEQARRHDVLPGITGWAQVNGRNSLSWEERFELDVWYIDNWSIWLDLKILLKTIRTIFIREGISADGHATMPDFRGSTRHQ